MKNVNIIVTGGCGFVGGHLVKKLVATGTKVTVLDIYSQPDSIFEINKLGKKANLCLIDIRKRNETLSIFKKIRPVFVIHLAAEPIVEKVYQNPFNAFETNIMGTVNILEAARTVGGVKGIIVASSDKAYGKTSKTYKENSPLQGDHPYDVSKSCEDLIAQSYYKTYGLPIVITRFGNIYGEGDLNFGRIIPDICKAIIQKETLLIRSNGKYVRDYVYVQDVVDGYTTLLNKIEKIHGEAYNFSSEDTLSVLKVVKQSEKIFGVKISYRILNTAKNEIPYQHLNDSKIRKLGWTPKYNLNTSLQKTFLWYKWYLRKINN